MRKHLTAEAEQWVRERIAQHNDNLEGWIEPDGYLVPTEPDAECRRETRAELRSARYELVQLLVRFCGVTEEECEALSWNGARVVMRASASTKRHEP